MTRLPESDVAKLDYAAVPSRQTLRKDAVSRVYRIFTGFGAGLAMGSAVAGLGVPVKLLALLGGVMMLLAAGFFMWYDRD